MKTASTALANLINSGAFYCCDVYTMTSVNGPVVRLTTADFDVIDTSANVYHCGSIGSGYPKIDLKESKVQGHWTRGLDSDQWQVAILPAVTDPFTGSYTYPDVIGGTPWLAACRAGLFDGATVLVQRAYFSAPPTPPYTVLSRTCVGTLIIFSGIVGEVDANQTLSIFTINDYKYLLTMDMPRNLFQSACRHTLFDARCTLSASSYSKTANAQAGSSRSVIVASPATPGGSGSYQLGRVLCTSGLNSTFQRTITNVSGTSFQLQYPFPFAVSAGDGFTFWPGCDKSTGSGGCGGFSNIVNFGGMPFTPVPEVQVG